jgi:hypothetical protein
VTWFLAILEAVLRALLPALFEAAGKAATPTAEDAQAQPELGDRLRKRIRSTWGGVAVPTVLLAALFLGGCARTIYVPDGTPVRLRETVRGAKVWVLDAAGRPVAGRMDLPEGWYCLPDPEPCGPGGCAVGPPLTDPPNSEIPHAREDHK